MSDEEIRKLVSSNGIIKAAILATLEGGCTCETGEYHPWELDHADDEGPAQAAEIVQQQRQRFAQAVIARLAKS
jgi:hypothetical protein